MYIIIIYQTHLLAIIKNVTKIVCIQIVIIITTIKYINIKLVI